MAYLNFQALVCWIRAYLKFQVLVCWIRAYLNNRFCFVELGLIWSLKIWVWAIWSIRIIRLWSMTKGCKPGQCYVGDRLLPMQHAPPLHLGDGSKGTAGPLQFGTSDVAGAARMRLSTTTNCLRDSNDTRAYLKLIISRSSRLWFPPTFMD